ncbi:MAG: PEP-CTERM sorting domain-containing protein [Phycisphaerae bacterium]|nr:PEP-CTERM sorting domain-containing protein [Phycisphaerae bacterium]
MRQLPWMVSCALGTVIATGIANSAGAEMVGYWHCNGVDPDVSTVVAASLGSGTLDFTSFGTGATIFAGTDVNGQPGVIAGDSIGLSGSSHNGSYAQIDLSTVGFADLALSFAARRSATGFGNDHVEALIGGAWTTVASFNPSTTAWGTISIDLAALNSLENGSASLRLYFDGATSGSGTVRFDNLTVTGTATVPAPGAIALLGAAAAFGRRRRRAER